VRVSFRHLRTLLHEKFLNRVQIRPWVTSETVHRASCPSQNPPRRAWRMRYATTSMKLCETFQIFLNVFFSHSGHCLSRPSAQTERMNPQLSQIPAPGHEVSLSLPHFLHFCLAIPLSLPVN
jgi:hypothetical protein